MTERTVSVISAGVPVYSPADNGLGDHWAAVNWCLRHSISCGEEVRLSDRPVLEWHPEKFRAGRLAEIVSLLNHAGGSVRLVQEPATHRLGAEEIWQLPYLPTRTTWRPNSTRRVCYQSDPVTMAVNAMSEKEEAALVEALGWQGCEPFRLHVHVPLEHCVEILAECEALVCTSSGFSHVAHSVGTPLFLVRGAADLGYLIKHHVGKTYVLCASYLDAVERIILERSIREQADGEGRRGL